MSGVVKKAKPLIAASVGAYVGFLVGGPSGALRGASIGYSLGSSKKPGGNPRLPSCHATRWSSHGAFFEMAERECGFQYTDRIQHRPETDRISRRTKRLPRSQF